VAPVYDDQGRVALSVSVAYPPFALVSMSPRACGERLLVTARAITRAIGGRQPVRA
jgi:DNA-binding IclR family transcriptional regulator